MNQHDQARSYNIQLQHAYKKLHMQWQEAYKKLYECGLELDAHLNEEEVLNHNLCTQLQTVTAVNKGWDQAYRTLQSRSNL